MLQPLALCKNGHFFQSGTGFDPGETGITATLTVQSAPRICPECGAPARVLGGSYHIAKDTIELLQGSERTVSELERLRTILRAARESGASPEAIGDTLQREFPGWGQALAKKLVPKTPGDFFGLLSLIVAIIGVLLAHEGSEQAKDTEPDQIINNITVVQQTPSAQRNPEIAPDTESTTSSYGQKIGRNERCPCGSRLKFKKCHGKNGEKRYHGP